MEYTTTETTATNRSNQTSNTSLLIPYSTYIYLARAVKNSNAEWYIPLDTTLLFQYFMTLSDLMCITSDNLYSITYSDICILKSSSYKLQLWIILKPVWNFEDNNKHPETDNWCWIYLQSRKFKLYFIMWT